MSDSTEIRKGLVGVVADTTAVSKVNVETNSLLYRGYPVQELAAMCSFEEVVNLLWRGDLATPDELARSIARERSHRELGDRLMGVIERLPDESHPMDVVRTAVSVMGGEDPTAWSDDPEEIRDKALILIAKIPAVVAYIQRHRRGLPMIAPRDDLGYAANFLWMTFGEEPPEVVRKAFDVSMTLYAEHSFNASTFTARVVTSTLSDYYSAIVAAIGALKGPLHGGANEAVMRTFDEIGSADNVVPWLDDALAHKRKIMGFGHRVYKRGDSRVPTMKAALDTLIAHYDRPDIAALYDALEAEFVGRKGIYPNLDYPSGPAYHLMGFDTELFTPIFVASRIAGWTAHIQEQLAHNALIRPLSLYDGPAERHIDGYTADAASLEAATRQEEMAG
ncbi:bifunctional 2-methylcitrate synthase/citrate synthase [Demequina sp. SYSU T00192]|uniref:Citrate synthase n=1 Tax=Demequina litoralis TaxID=3051660 RepID=A0ABT8G694_9MICO|nr:bifunctional 2-methylcitrate synthase/citrate synthase [Demequina sp. SYSU T00192]MDN4474647.1 bifunctional 2-methylcitrate synthase/citrate synthase [Demequina sp. SYSU T00192]